MAGAFSLKTKNTKKLNFKHITAVLILDQGALHACYNVISLLLEKIAHTAFDILVCWNVIWCAFGMMHIN